MIGYKAKIILSRPLYEHEALRFHWWKKRKNKIKIEGYVTSFSTDGVTSTITFEGNLDRFRLRLST